MERRKAVKKRKATVYKVYPKGGADRESVDSEYEVSPREKEIPLADEEVKKGTSKKGSKIKPPPLSKFGLISPVTPDLPKRQNEIAEKKVVVNI